MAVGGSAKLTNPKSDRWYLWATSLSWMRGGQETSHHPRHGRSQHSPCLRKNAIGVRSGGHKPAALASTT